MKAMYIAALASIVIHAILLVIVNTKVVLVKEPVLTDIVLRNIAQGSNDDWGYREAIEKANKDYPCLKWRD